MSSDADLDAASKITNLRAFGTNIYESLRTKKTMRMTMRKERKR
jgi:hypothetical protein